MKNLFLSIFVVLLLFQKGKAVEQIKLFPLSSVKLIDGLFLKAQQADLKYILTLDPDRLLAPYMRESGLEPKAESYGNWENTGLDGHIGGHYLSALSMMYASTGEEELLRRLNYMVNQLWLCQKNNGNGYVGGIPGGAEMWKQIAAGDIRAGRFSLNDKWVPWYNIHKIYAGLRDAWLFVGNEKAKEMLVALTGWSNELVKDLSDEQIQQMLLSEHGGMNEVFADVAEITGDDKYLELARKFSHREILDPLLAEEDRLNGFHANTQIPKIVGYKRVAEVAKDSAWEAASTYFWNAVVDHRTISIGGNSVREHFHPSDDFSSMVESREGPETCNTYNMLKLSKMLFSTQHNAKYIDFYERGLYNHILSSQHPEKGGFVYFTPMRPCHYRVYSQPDQGFWCCVGSGLENHAKYGELIYSHQDNDLYVNLFIPSQLNWQEKGIEIRQLTNFPSESATRIIMSLKRSKKFTLHIRHPEWVKSGEFQVMVNGKKILLQSSPSSYIKIHRKWKDGDEIKVVLPMEVMEKVIPDNSPWVSFEYGPIVLGTVTDTSDVDGLWADDSRMGHIANGALHPLQESPMVVGNLGELAHKVKCLDKHTLTFEAPGMLYPERYAELKFVPFYTIHESRYAVYMRQSTQGELEKLRTDYEQKENEKLALEMKTIDQVAPGEQQPESDHGFQSKDSRSGVNQNRHWRDATGWFSYFLKNPDQENCVLRVTYFGKDHGRSFDILINDQVLGTTHLSEDKGDVFYDVDFPVPDSIISSSGGEPLLIKFKAHEGSIAGGVYYVRLLRK